MTPKLLARAARLLTLVLSPFATAPAAAWPPVALAPARIEAPGPAAADRASAAPALSGPGGTSPRAAP